MTTTIPTRISFFQKLIPLITSGMKTITLRDESEKHYMPGTEVDVYSLESDEYAGRIAIHSVETISFDDLDETHAKQEAMPLAELKTLIREIYPDIDTLYMITFTLISKSMLSKE